jgi:hypothetical protein
MAEYIDKHEAYTLLKDLEAAYIYPPVREAYGTAARHIDQIKPADVQTVKHGKFIPFTDKQFYEHFKKQPHNIPFDGECSICGAKMFNTDNYCGECGARMEEGQDD